MPSAGAATIHSIRLRAEAKYGADFLRRAEMCGLTIRHALEAMA